MAVGKHDLAAELAAARGLTKKDSKEIIDELFGLIGGHLTEGEDVRIQNYVTFKVVDRAERNGRNPQTGEAIVIEARKAPVAKFSETLKAAIR